MATLSGVAWLGCPEPGPGTPDAPPPSVQDAGASVDRDTAPAPTAPDTQPAEADTPVAAPLAGRVDLRPPAAVRDKAPRTEDGLPMVVVPPRPPSDAVAFSVVYDETLRDPVTRWADCLSLLVACRQDTEGPVLPCVRTLPHCPEDAPETDTKCCPAACVMPLVDQLSAGTEEMEALQRTILKGDCVEGLAEARAGAAKAFEALPGGSKGGPDK